MRTIHGEMQLNEQSWGASVGCVDVPHTGVCMWACTHVCNQCVHACLPLTGHQALDYHGISRRGFSSGPGQGWTDR